MADYIRAAITFLLSNFTLTFIVIGLVFSFVAIARASKPVTTAVAVEKLLSWHVFWVIGVANFYNFIMHGFFGKMSAAFIGWEDSPFQFEVATASLGFAVVGFLAAFRSFDLRLAAIVGPSCFLLGAAAGHVYQMVTAHNFAPGNAGSSSTPTSSFRCLASRFFGLRIGIESRSLIQPAGFLRPGNPDRSFG
jgi:hypothetical protein